jgi:hypothetical protein
LTIQTLHIDGVTTAIKVTDQAAAVHDEKRVRRPVTDLLLPTPFSWRQANMNKGFDSRLDQGWWVLRIGLGIGPFLAGLERKDASDT